MVENKDPFTGLGDDDIVTGNYDESAALFVTLLPTPDALSASSATPPPSPPPPLGDSPPASSGAPGNARDEDRPPPPYAHVVVSTSDAHDGHEGASHERVKVGAGFASGAFGLLAGGPVLAILLGLGTAYAADQPGAAGDAARTVGEVAIVAQNKFKKLDEQHKFVEKGQLMAAKAVHKLQEADREHRLVDRFKDFATRSFHSISLYVKEHRLIERGTQAIGTTAYWAANKIADKIQSHQQQQQGATVGVASSPQYLAVNSSDKLDDNSTKNDGK